MKQLLFLLLFPAFALAQYPGNANQKITLGEQTTADGLVYRGMAADTTRKPSVDTMAYILLDTNTNIIWQYKKETSNAWLRLNLLPSDTTSMLTNYYRSGRALGTPLSGTLTNATGLPISTGLTGLGAANRIPYASSTTALTTSSGLTFDGTNFATTGTATATRFNPTGTSATGNGMYLPAANTLGFSTNGTEKVRITSGGELLINTMTDQGVYVLQANGNVLVGTDLETTAATSELRVGNKEANSAVRVGQGATNNGFMTWFYNGTPASAYLALGTWGGNNKLALQPDGGNVGIGTTSPQSGYRLHVVDSVYVGGNVSASAYTTRSDYDLKDEIQNISYGINEVMQMQPVKYTYKSNGSTQLGFIAQDLGVITPEVVSFEDKMSVYYNALIPILTKAIQEQQALIKALEQRIINLENK